MSLPARTNGEPDIPEVADGMGIRAKATIVTGVLIASAFFGIGGVWAVNASIEGAVIAPGELITEGNRTRVQHREGGTVAAIEVRDGQEVEAGDPLVRLEDARLRSEVIALSAEYYGALGRSARLRAERGNLAEISFPEEMLERASDPLVSEILRSEQEVFEARVSTFEGQREILAARIPQYHSMIRGLDAQVAALEEQRVIFEEELENANALLEQGLTRRAQVQQLRRSLLSADGQIGDLAEKRAQTALAISEIEMRILDMEESRLLEIEDELATLGRRIIDLRDRLAAAQDELERTVIRAPLSGRVLGLSVHNVGAVLEPASVVLSIVPSSGAMVVHARVTPLDVDLLTEGQEARIVLSAFKQSEVAPIEGRVLRVSADRLEDERTGDAFFETVLELDDAAGNQAVQLVPGMPVEVYINTGARSPIDYLLQPLRDSFGRAFRES